MLYLLQRKPYRHFGWKSLLYEQSCGLSGKATYKSKTEKLGLHY
jgi:hypothetical protein